MYDVKYIVNEITKKLADPKYVSNIIDKENLKYSKMHQIDKFSLASGLPSLSILFSELDSQYPNRGYDEIAHSYLNQVVKSLNMNNISLFQGLTGIGASAHCMSNNGKRYKSFLKDLNVVICKQTQKKLNFIESKDVFNEDCYDVISGLSGIASYYLLFLEDNEMNDKLKEILKYLISISILSVDIGIEAKNSIHIKAGQQKNNKYINFGFAHGIPGILTILVQAYKKGVKLLGQMESIKYLADFLIENCVKDGDNIVWTYDNLSYIGVNEDLFTRDAWCYGTPGVAYAILQAADLLQDEGMKEISCKAMKNSLLKRRGLVSPTFCHGFCGVMYITKYFYEYTKDKLFLDEYNKLKKEIILAYNSKYPFGFINKEYVDGKLIDKNEIGILTGCVGVLLVLLDSEKSAATPWNAIFLLRKI